MSLHIFRQEDRTVNHWSGGTTTELYIHPKSATYAKKDFDFRLSIATIEVEKSIFTPLAGVDRTTLILDGVIELTHEGRYSKTLKKFDFDSYEGAWNTSSIGKCTDFNVMTRGKVTSTIEHRTLKKGKVFELIPKGKEAMQFIYIHEGEAVLFDQIQMQPLPTGSLVSFENFSEKVRLEAKGTVELLIIDLIL